MADLIRSVFGINRRAKKNSKLTSEDLMLLSDDELYESLNDRIIYEAGDMDADEVCITFPNVKSTYYSALIFDIETNNGGLCQYFTNPSSISAPYLLESLKAIGASEVADMVVKFIRDNNLSLYNLEEFRTDSVDGYEDNCSKYPFDDFDDMMFGLSYEDSVTACLIDYGRKHLEEL